MRGISKATQGGGVVPCRAVPGASRGGRGARGGGCRGVWVPFPTNDFGAHHGDKTVAPRGVNPLALRKNAAIRYRNQN